MKQRPILTTILTVLVCLFAMAGTTDAKTIYVDADAPGANDGSTWADAYYYLQDALMFATAGDQIRVAQGVYKPDDFVLSRRPNLGREETFQLKNGVTIKGGYAGFGQADPDARDVNEYETILSGDLNGDDVGDWWDHPSRYENSYHVVTGNGTDETCTFDGFTVTGGYANGSYGNARGSGMYNENGSPTVANCTFERNLAHESGGGMYVSQSNPTIADCNFNRNVAVNGGGIFNEESSPTITNCNFNGNEARYGFWGFGGGVYNYQSNPIIERCIMTNNYAEWGGGIACNENSSPTIKNCTISGNLAYQEGGGICCSTSSNPAITDSIIVSNGSEEGGGGGIGCLEGSAPIIANSIVSGNYALGGQGAGMYCSSNSNPMIDNCLFVGNDYEAIWSSTNSRPSLRNCTIAYSAQGISCYEGGSPTVRNCIVWASVTLFDDYSKPLIMYSDVQGGWPGEGNINADPCFANPDSGDYHLKSQAGRWDVSEGGWTTDEVTSPCIDAGDPMSPIGLEPFPNGGIINMGAYGSMAEASKSYFGEPPCEIIVAGDINGDCEVNFSDLCIMALHWCENNNL